MPDKFEHNIDKFVDIPSIKVNPKDSHEEANKKISPFFKIFIIFF